MSKRQRTEETGPSSWDLSSHLGSEEPIRESCHFFSNSFYALMIPQGIDCQRCGLHCAGSFF
jgi:hypothetical protein